MNDQLFEPYYKRGFSHFIFKNLMKLKRPTNEIRVFYFSLITLILTISLIVG